MKHCDILLRVVFRCLKGVINSSLIRCLLGLISNAALGSASLAGEKPPKSPLLESIRVPIEFNAFPASKWAPTSIDPDARHDRIPFNIKLKPAIPFPLNQDWTLLTYTVLRFSSIPWGSLGVEYSPDGIPFTSWTQDNRFGLAVVNPTAVFVPHLSRDFVVGIGPSVSAPVGKTPLSDRIWTIGPAVFVSWKTGPWRLGARIHNMFSFAGDEANDNVNLFIIRGKFVYQLHKDWFLVSAPIITNDWNHPDGKGWMLPVGGGIGRIFQLGQSRASFSVQAYYNLLQPDLLGEQLTGDWSIRTDLNFMIPK